MDTLPLAWSPKKSVLQQTISAISATSWEAINHAVLSSAQQRKLDDGSMVRIDSTVTEALIHAPTDSSLLWDGVRVMVRLLRQAETLSGPTPIRWRNHRRLAKKRAAAIQYARGQNRKKKLYRDLIAATRATMALPRLAAQHLLEARAGPISMIAEAEEIGMSIVAPLLRSHRSLRCNRSNADPDLKIDSRSTASERFHGRRTIPRCSRLQVAHAH